MSRFNRTSSFRLLVCALAFCSGARDSNGTPPADRNRSHGEIPGGGLADQAQLQQRLLQARLAAEFQGLVGKNKADPRFLQSLQADPKRQEEIEKLLRSIMENHPGLAGKVDRSDPTVRQLESLYKDWGGKEGTRPPGFDHDLWKKMENTAKAPNTSRRPTPAPPPPAGLQGADQPLSANGQPPSQPPPSSPRSNPFATPQSHGVNERIIRWAQRFVEQNPSLRDSHILRSVAEEIDRVRLRDALRTDSPIASQLARGIDRLMPSQTFIDDKLRPMLNRIPRPNFPDVQLPSIDLPQVTMPSVDWSPPGIGVPSRRTLGVGLLAILAAVAILYLIRRVHLPRRELQQDAYSNATKYRFDFRTPLRTRQDLVRTFEQLSLQELGPDAKNWNHRAIAEQLGGNSFDRRRSAAVLAGLYETARYAPDSEELPPDAIGVAQREVRLLAEAPHA